MLDIGEKPVERVLHRPRNVHVGHGRRPFMVTLGSLMHSRGCVAVACPIEACPSVAAKHLPNYYICRMTIIVAQQVAQHKRRFPVHHRARSPITGRVEWHPTWREGPGDADICCVSPVTAADVRVAALAVLGGSPVPRPEDQPVCSETVSGGHYHSGRQQQHHHGPSTGVKVKRKAMFSPAKVQKRACKTARHWAGT